MEIQNEVKHPLSPEETISPEEIISTEAEPNMEMIEDVLLHFEEERLAKQFEELENNMQDPQVDDLILEKSVFDDSEQVLSENENGETDSGGGKADEKVLKEILGKEDSLKIMEYGDEIFIPQKTNDGYITIHSASNILIRNFYDNLFRLTRKEVWDYKDYANAKIKEVYTFIYYGNSYVIKTKTLETSLDYSVFEYREDGLLVLVSRYIQDNENRYKVSGKIISYNSDNRIEKEETKIYTLSSDNKKVLDTFCRKYVYSYNSEDIPPDYEYFENNELKIKTKYSVEKGTYTSHVYFSRGISVKSYYINNKKVQDVYYKNGKVTRVKNYEKEKTDSEF